MRHIPRGAALYTTGWLSQTFQRPVGEITAILDAVGVTPVLVINDIAHFDGNAIIALREASADD